MPIYIHILNIIKGGKLKMYVVSETARKNNERIVGLTCDKLAKMSAIEEKNWIEKRIGKKLAFSQKMKKGVVGRGNPLLSRRKIRTLEDLDKKSKKYIGI